jgi:hypothetical protein
MPPLRAASTVTSPGLPLWRPRRQRKAAAAGALAVTLAALWALWPPPARRLATAPEGTAPTWLRLLPPSERPREASLPALPRAGNRTATPPPRAPAWPTPDVQVQRAAAEPQPITLAEPSPSTPPSTPAAPAPAVAASAPRPLRLGDEVLRRAARDSLAETRRLAADAGLPAERGVSGSERLADGVEQAVKPDCLAPNAGGSLLSIPIIALQALRQKCK